MGLSTAATKARVRSVVLGTAGHIDHGKTALVLALTGTDTDRLPDEKARGITIDLGFAAMDLAGPHGELIEASLIDVPGHHAFVRNMLAGAGGIDAVMLVIAADEGGRAQTVEHLQICRLLGIRYGLVVLTKRDAVPEERIQEVRAEVARLVEGTFLEGAPVLPVSALRREGMDALKTALGKLAAALPMRGGDRVMRLPVDRVFTVRGFGTVVTGTLQAGRVQAGESLQLEPGGRAVRVRGLQVHGHGRAEAEAPNRVALNLAGIEVGEIERGVMVVRRGTLAPVDAVDVAVTMVASTPEIRHRQRLRIHAFASESLAMVLLFPREQAEGIRARLKLAKPMVLVPGDRLVLRLPSPARTVGGAVVLDAHPLPRLRRAATATWLRSLEGADTTTALRLRVARRGTAGLTWADLVAETGWAEAFVRQRVAPLLAGGEVVVAPGAEILLAAGAVQAAQARVLREVLAAGDAQVGRAALRGRAGLTELVFGIALKILQDAGRVVVQGDNVGRPRPAAGAEKAATEDTRTARVEQLYREAGLAAPIVSEAATLLRMGQADLKTILTTLLRAGTLVRMGSDALLVHAEAVARLTAALRTGHRGRSFDVTWFKGYTGLTRKHAIPLLEYLDGARVTRNVGGARQVL